MAEYQLPKLATGVRFPSLACSVIKLLAIGYWLLAISGCATAPPHSPPTAEFPKITGGIYHQVNKGDTLWRIAKTYGIGLADIVRANGLSDATKVTSGQRIFIPGAKTPLLVTTEKSKMYESDYFIWPVEGEVVSSFGQKFYNTQNKGIDIKTHAGEKILASKSGKVVFSGSRLKGYGNTIIIDHLDGFYTIYSRNLENLVKRGDSVSQRQVVALAGSTGRGEAAHLHFEIRRRSRPQNPLYYLP